MCILRNFFEKKRLLILAITVILLAVGLPNHLPLVHAVPSSATSCVTTDCKVSPVVNNAFAFNRGNVASEAKIDQAKGFYDGGTTAYGDTKPSIYIGLMARISPDARTSWNPNFNLRTLSITVTIKDSSGNIFSPQPSNGNAPVSTTFWYTPSSSGATDSSGALRDLATWFAGFVVPYPGLPDLVHPQVTNGVTLNPNTIVGQWTDWGFNFPDQTLRCTVTQCGSNPTTLDKSIELNVVPNFAKSDVYTISVSTHAEQGECDQGNFSPFTIVCYVDDRQDQSYSFKYVYENDAGFGGDAADSLPNAGGSPGSVGHASYTGILYGIDTADVYNFLVAAGETAAFVETPPASADFRLTVFETDGGTVIQTVDQGVGATSGIQFTSSSGGTYFAKIEIVTGWGAYSFRITNGFKISASPSGVSLGVAGTGSSVTSTITLGSVGNFNERVALSASVSPSIPNGPTTFFNVVSSQIVVSPTTSSASNLYSPHTVSWPEKAYVQDDYHALFQSATFDSGAVVPAYYTYGYTLPSTAGISKLEVGPVHFESTCCGNPNPTPIVSVLVGPQNTSFTVPNNIHLNTGGNIGPQPVSWYTQSWVDISPQISQITSTQFSLTYEESSTGTTTEGYVDWLPIRVTYTSVQLTPGSSDSRGLTISTTASTPPGIYTVTVTGSSTGGISSTVPVTVAVQDFQITTDVQSMKLSIGQSATTTITVTPIDGFTGTVALSVGAPGGYTAGLTTNTISGGSGTSVLTISHTSTAQFDPTTITVSGVSGARTQTNSITVINPPPAIKLSTSPRPIITTAGQSAGFTVTVSSLYGFTGTVSISERSPSSLTCTAPNPSSVTLTSTTTQASASISCTAPAGLYTLNVTGTSGSLSSYTLSPFTIQDFTISASPASVPVIPGATGSSTITVTPNFGFTGAVTLSSSVTPTGLSCSFTNTSITGGSGSQTLNCNGGSPQTSYTVTITGNSGSLTHTATVTFTFTALYSFRDDFTYSSVSSMVSAGWTVCGTQSGQVSVGNSILALTNDGTNVGEMCWNNIPAGMASWTVTIRGQYTTQLLGYTNTNGATWLSLTTASHNYQFDLDGYNKYYYLFRDGVTLRAVPGYVPQLGAWHDLTLDMRNGVLTALADGKIIATYAETSGTNTALTQVMMMPGWGTVTNFDWVTIKQVNNAQPADFIIGSSPISSTTSMGTSAVTTINLSSVASFTGTVALTSSISPATGLTCNLNPTSVSLTSSATSTLTCNGSTGTYNLTIKGTSGSLSHNTNATITIAPTTLSNNPSSSDWATISGTWTQKNGVIDGSGTYPRLKSTVSYTSNRVVTVRMRTITSGPNLWNVAWTYAKYIDENNRIAVYLRPDGYIELDYTQNGSTLYFTSTQQTQLKITDWHTFTTTFLGNEVKVQVDGTTYIDATNSSFSTFGAASVALATPWIASGSDEGQFDSVTIS